MPIYEYSCTKCKVTKELILSIKSKEKPICKKCKTIMKRKISKSTFILKGKGWFKDGY